MSMFTDFRDSTLKYLIPLAISVLKSIVDKVSPEFKGFIVIAIRDLYAKALSTPNEIDDTIVATIIAPLFGVDLTGVTAESDGGTNAAIKDMPKVLADAIVGSVKDEVLGPNHPSNQP